MRFEIAATGYPFHSAVGTDSGSLPWRKKSSPESKDQTRRRPPSKELAAQRTPSDRQTAAGSFRVWGRGPRACAASYSGSARAMGAVLSLLPIHLAGPGAKASWILRLAWLASNPWTIVKDARTAWPKFASTGVVANFARARDGAPAGAGSVYYDHLNGLSRVERAEVRGNSPAKRRTAQS